MIICTLINDKYLLFLYFIKSVMKNKNKKMIKIKIINKKEKVRFFGDNTIHKVKNSPPKIISLIDNNKIFINQK